MHKKIYKKEKKQQLEKKKSFKNFIKNKNYIYIFLILINIVFTIYIAKKNSVHYVKVLNNDVLISNDKLLFLGRGYINLLIIGFFSLYTILIDKFLLKKKITFKSSILIILLYSILDVVLFYLFINRIF
ncbi:MAG: hypothetical protein PUD25_02555 [Bacilli bacterium]|nr:hypothetical protein [Bacilli bacterium]